jgi:hypothetical protein
LPYAQPSPSFPAATAHRAWLLAVPLAVTAVLLPHKVQFARAEASIAPARPAAAVEALPAPPAMAASPQSGWRPAGLQTGLELHFAPSAVLQHPRFIGT